MSWTGKTEHWSEPDEGMKTYITVKDGCAGPDIEACDHSHAEQIAEKLGIIVIGELGLRIQSETMTEAKADDITRQLADSIEA